MASGSRLVARTCSSRARSQQLAQELRARAHQVLAVVEHQQHAACAADTRSGHRHRSRGWTAGIPRTAATAPATCDRLGQLGELDQPAPSAYVEPRGAEPARARGVSCPRPPAPTSVNSGAVSSIGPSSRISCFAADEAVQRPRQVVLAERPPIDRRPPRMVRRAGAGPSDGGASHQRLELASSVRRPRPSAWTSCATVSRRGVAPSPRSSPLILRGLMPARSASSSWVSPAARR